MTQTALARSFKECRQFLKAIHVNSLPHNRIFQNQIVPGENTFVGESNAKQMVQHQPTPWFNFCQVVFTIRPTQKAGGMPLKVAEGGQWVLK